MSGECTFDEPARLSGAGAHVPRTHGYCTRPGPVDLEALAALLHAIASKS